MAWDATLKALRDQLLELYSVEDGRVLADDVGLDRSLLQGKARTAWHNLLLEAENRGLVDRLIDLVIEDFPAHQKFAAAAAAYRGRRMHGLPDTREETAHVELSAESLGLAPAELATGISQQKQQFMRDFVQEWARRADLDHWQQQLSPLIAPLPMLAINVQERLVALGGWLFNRVWPGQFAEVEAALRNFLNVLQDLMKEVDRHAEISGNTLRIPRAFKRQFLPQSQYNAMTERYDAHIDLISDLVFELTRAANYVCDQVRATIMPNYRLENGVVTLVGGPNEELNLVIYKTQYQENEKAAEPYPGLELFINLRRHRDWHSPSSTKQQPPRVLAKFVREHELSSCISEESGIRTYRIMLYIKHALLTNMVRYVLDNQPAREVFPGAHGLFHEYAEIGHDCEIKVYFDDAETPFQIRLCAALREHYGDAPAAEVASILASLCI